MKLQLKLWLNNQQKKGLKLNKENPEDNTEAEEETTTETINQENQEEKAKLVKENLTNPELMTERDLTTNLRNLQLKLKMMILIHH